MEPSLIKLHTLENPNPTPVELTETELNEQTNAPLPTGADNDN